jgi:alkanesulfonate monooxygenase SsuD/methylene tetrahydromethanopterin reductase-like flavin-dependent oxidoreductase (luciferase family)
MRFGVYVPNFGSYADPRSVLQLALAAEQAGWDGFFMWDHMIFRRDDPVEILDPWLILAAIAAQTQRIALGPLVTPLARRRPWKVAREAVALDRISRGRAILGVGLGADGAEFSAFNEDPDARTRAAKLNEALELIVRFWAGDTVYHSGTHYRVDGVRLSPGPLQVPRIPIWVGARWPAVSDRPYRRAARYDGVFPLAHDYRSDRPLPLRQAGAAFGHTPVRTTTFEFIHAGASTGDRDRDRPLLTEAEQFGITWWLESFDPFRGEIGDALERVRLGPPAGRPAGLHACEAHEGVQVCWPGLGGQDRA